MTKLEIDKINIKINALISEARLTMLESLELPFGHTTQWPQIRALVLKVFGERGMLPKIKEILDQEYDANWGEE